MNGSIPDPPGSACVMAAVRELYGVRVDGQFVVYDSHCVDAPHRADMCMTVTPADGRNALAMNTALDTGTPYGRQVLRARVNCGGYTLAEITSTANPDETAALRTALTYFNTTSTNDRERAVFAALYQHLTLQEHR